MDLLASVLKKKREELGLTLREVEKRTGVSNAYLSQVENQKITKPSPIILKRLSETYNTSYARLMEMAGYPVETKEKSAVLFRTSQGLEDITKVEERELLEYLRFLRQRRIGK